MFDWQRMLLKKKIDVSETFNVPSVYLQCHVTGMMKKLADSSYLLVDEENMAQ